MKRVLGVLGLLLSPLCACASPPAPPDAAVEDPSPELDVIEATFRFQLEEYAQHATRFDYIFLELARNQDPPAELLARFAGHTPPVVPISQSKPDKWLGPHHKSDDGKGFILGVTSVRWIDVDTAEVKGGYHRGNRGSSWHTFEARRREGKWVIVSDRTYAAS